MSLLHAHVVQIPVTAHPQKRAVGPGHWYVLRDRRPAPRYRRLQRTLCAIHALQPRLAGSVTHVSSCNPSPLDTLTVVPDAPTLGEHDRIRQNKQPLGKSNSRACSKSTGGFRATRSWTRYQAPATAGPRLATDFVRLGACLSCTRNAWWTEHAVASLLSYVCLPHQQETGSAGDQRSHARGHQLTRGPRRNHDRSIVRHSGSHEAPHTLPLHAHPSGAALIVKKVLGLSLCTSVKERRVTLSLMSSFVRLLSLLERRTSVSCGLKVDASTEWLSDRTGRSPWRPGSHGVIS